MKRSEFQEGVTPCPLCQNEDFGTRDCQPVTVSGWYGNAKLQWQSSPHTIILVAVKCANCEHIEDIERD